MKQGFIIGFALLSALLGAQSKVIAHRGYWKASNLPQNSVAALKAAQELGVYGSEFDVQRTLDGVLILNHDADIQGKIIADTPYKELKKIRLDNGERIPTLRKYLKVGKKEPSTRLIIELKPTKDLTLEKEIVRAALEEVNKVGVGDQVVYISFALGICEELKRQDPSVHVQYLKGDLSPQELYNKNISGLDYHYEVLRKYPLWIKQAKELGLSTNSWTVNDPKIVEILEKMGIDQVTTDIPEQILKK